MKKVTVIIPCYNEADAIEAVIKGFPKQKLLQYGYKLDILVVDNNSKDNTAEIARKAGARVIKEMKQGKGNAIRSGFYAIGSDTDYVVMLDGDNTYRPSEILRLIEPLDSGFSDVIIGSRMAGRIKMGSMTWLNRLGNWVFSFMVRVVYQVNVTDVLTGYFAWKREAIQKLRPYLQSQGFAIEMEMITKMARLNFDIYSVPISYEPRLGETSLRPFYDGSRILMAYVRQLRWRPKIERIAFVSDAIYPYNKGGKEKRLHEITRRLVKEGREVHVYTMKWWEGERDIVEDGVNLHGISKLYPLYAGDRRSIKQAILFSLACLKLVKARFDLVDVDHMPVFPLITMRIVCWMKFKKMYATWHEVWGKSYWKEYLGKRGVIGWLSEYISFQLPDVIISNSQHTTNDLKTAGVKKEIKTIPLGVDLASILDAPVQNMESDVIYVGRLLPNKNVDMLIRALARIKRYKKDMSCVLVGDGPERKKLEGLIASLKLQKNVTFLHFVEDHNELYGIMKASKLCVLPSEREGFGLIALEANACGLPVLTLNHPKNAAVSLIYPGKNGDLFKDEYGLSRQLKRYLVAPKKPELLSYVENYDWSKTAELINEEYAL